jgi:hypothetical protein
MPEKGGGCILAAAPARVEAGAACGRRAKRPKMASTARPEQQGRASRSSASRKLMPAEASLRLAFIPAARLNLEPESRIQNQRTLGPGANTRPGRTEVRV